MDDAPRRITFCGVFGRAITENVITVSENDS